MNGSNIDARNSIHRTPLRDTYLLIAGLLGGFGLFIVLALGLFSGAQATYATPPPDPALTAHFGRMFHLPKFAPPNNAVRDALMELGRPGGNKDAKRRFATGPVAPKNDSQLQPINPNQPTHTAG